METIDGAFLNSGLVTKEAWPILVKNDSHAEWATFDLIHCPRSHGFGGMPWPRYTTLDILDNPRSLAFNSEDCRRACLADANTNIRESDGSLCTA